MSWYGLKPNAYWKSVQPCKLYDHRRYVPKTDFVDKVEDILKLSIKDYDRIRPYSPAWYYAREYHPQLNNGKFRYGGSSLGTLLGFFTSYTQNYWGEKWPIINNDFQAVLMSGTMENTKPKEISPRTQLCFDWGHAHESNAILEFLNSWADIEVLECGPKVYNIPQSPISLFVTPDGLWRNTRSGLTGCLEVKSRFPFNYDEDKERWNYSARVPWSHRKNIYEAQIQFEMIATGELRNINLCYTPSVTRGWIIERDDLYIAMCEDALRWLVHKYIHKRMPFPDDPEISPYADYPEYKKLLDYTQKATTRKMKHFDIESSTAVWEVMDQKYPSDIFNDVDWPVRLQASQERSQVTKERKRKEPPKAKEVKLKQTKYEIVPPKKSTQNNGDDIIVIDP
jgi:hypothetical protein